MRKRPYLPLGVNFDGLRTNKPPLWAPGRDLSVNPSWGKGPRQAVSMGLQRGPGLHESGLYRPSHDPPTLPHHIQQPARSACRLILRHAAAFPQCTTFQKLA